MRSLHGPVIAMRPSRFNDGDRGCDRWRFSVLAERLGSGQSLIPDDREARIRMVGLINEMAGEQGFAWHCRVILLDTWASQINQAGQDANPMFKEYGYDAKAVEHSISTADFFLEGLAADLRQSSQGVGGRAIRRLNLC